MDKNERLTAQWCVDSETGEKFLIDLETGKKLARMDKKGNILPGEVHD